MHIFYLAPNIITKLTLLLISHFVLLRDLLTESKWLSPKIKKQFSRKKRVQYQGEMIRLLI